MNDEDTDYCEDNDAEKAVEELISRLTKETRPLAIRREIERRQDLARMRDQLGMDSFEFDEEV